MSSSSSSSSFSKTVEPLTPGGDGVVMSLSEHPPLDERETPLKRVVESKLMGPVGCERNESADNTVREKTEHYSGAGVSAEDDRQVFHEGSMDESLDISRFRSSGGVVVTSGDLKEVDKPEPKPDVRPKTFECNNPTSNTKETLPFPTKEHDIVIDEIVHLPFHLAADHHDVMILHYDKSDSELVRALNLKRFFISKCGPDTKVLVLKDDKHFSQVTEKLGEMEKAHGRCTLFFMLLSPEFCTDEFFRMIKDEYLMESLTDPKKKWSVIPLHTKKLEYKTPFGLNSLKGIHIENDMIGDADINDENLNVDDIKPRRTFKNNVQELIKEKMYMRKERQEELEKERKQYKEQVRHERRKKALQEKIQEERRQRQREEDLKKAKDDAEKQKKEPLSPSGGLNFEERDPRMRQYGGGEAGAQSHVNVQVTQNNYIYPQGEEPEEWDEENIEIIRGSPPQEEYM